MEGLLSKKVVLMLSASPKDAGRLRLQEEEREIKTQLRLAGYGHIPICSSGAARPRDIQQALLDFRPQVVHFSGHGERNGGLAFEDQTGNGKLVEPEALGRLFELFSRRSPVECVVLNACYSRAQAESIVRHVDYVIGMREEIKECAAIEFSVGFYKALGAGETYEFAYQLGRNAIELAGLAGRSVPALLVRKRDTADRRDSPLESLVDRESRGRPLDFRKLEGLLANRWWKEADIETTVLMLRSVDRGPGDWLREEELDSFPCDCLLGLDERWQRHSENRFGISAQRSIWEELDALGEHPKADGDLERAFGDRVEWRRSEVWQNYHDYQFDLSAPRGHLPRDYCKHALGWWLGRSCLLSTRLAFCQRVLGKGAAASV